MDRPLLFGKYCLLERISVGGMAEVFRGKPLGAPDPDRYFAIKRILPHLAEDVEFIKMFVDEARLTVQLDHDNIVQTYELGQFQSSHYIVMEFIAGKDLLAFQKLVRSQDTIVDVDMACHIVREIGRGLDYAHKKSDENGDPLGIIHRDVSPQNVLVSWDGRVRVIDFGIAKAASQSTKTKAGVLKGKFGYMSPEQVRGATIDHRSDIFSMGTLFWELLTNQRLFKAGSQFETMTLIGDPDIEPPSVHNPKIPAEVDQIAMKALAAEREDRYQWASEFARDLQGYLTSQKPPYHRSQLTTWLRSAFDEEFEEEKQKRERFRAINSAEDVRRRFDENYGEGGPDADQDSVEATEVWDVDMVPDEDDDLESFVSNHTVVQAGGLELSDYEDWDDAPDTIDEERDVVESRIEKVTGESMQKIKVAAESQYEVEPTVITDPGSSAPDIPELSTPATSVSGPNRSGPNGSTESPTANVGAMTSAPTPPQGLRAADTTRDGVDTKTPKEATKKSENPLATIDYKWLAVATTAVLVVITLCSAAVYVVIDGSNQEPPPPQVGGILVEVEPATELEIYVDGQWRGSESPLAIEGLAPGSYSIEVDHEEYPAWDDEVVVAADEVVTVNSDLGARGRLRLAWEEEPEEMQLRLDGQSLEPKEGQHEMELELARGTYLVEGTGQKVRPIRERVTVEAGVENTLDLEWTSYSRLTLTGDPELEVKFNGESYGALPLTLSDFSVGQIYDLAIGDFESAIGYPELGMGRIDAGDLKEFESRQREDFGWLVVPIDDDRQWHLLIDGVKTGLLVPSDDYDRLPVAAGDRTVGFERGEERRDFRVRIIEEETTRFRPDLP